MRSGGYRYIRWGIMGSLGGGLERNTGREKMGYMVPLSYLATYFILIFFPSPITKITPSPLFKMAFLGKKYVSIPRGFTPYVSLVNTQKDLSQPD